MNNSANSNCDSLGVFFRSSERFWAFRIAFPKPENSEKQHSWLA